MVCCLIQQPDREVLKIPSGGTRYYVEWYMGTNVLGKLVVSILWKGQDVRTEPDPESASHDYILSVITHLVSSCYHRMFTCNLTSVHYIVQLAVKSTTVFVTKMRRKCYAGHKNHVPSLLVQLLYIK